MNQNENPLRELSIEQVEVLVMIEKIRQDPERAKNILSLFEYALTEVKKGTSGCSIKFIEQHIKSRCNWVRNTIVRYELAGFLKTFIASSGKRWVKVNKEKEDLVTLFYYRLLDVVKENKKGEGDDKNG